MQKVAKMYKAFLRVKDRLFKEFGLTMIKLDSYGEVVSEDREHSKKSHEAKPYMGLTWEEIKRDYIHPSTSR